MKEEYFKKIMTLIVLGVLIVLAFFLIKPILLSVITGVILAFIFMPAYEKLFKVTKSKNLSATLICSILIVAITILIWSVTPIMIEQSFKVFLASQKIDFVSPLQKIFPSLTADFSNEIGNVIQSFVTKLSNSLLNSLSNIILNFPTIFLHFLVVFFTFFFVLRDKEELIIYIRSLLPFSPEIEKKLFDYSREITSSVIYGQIIIGIAQGILVGIGFFVFGISNAVFLTFLSIGAGVLPIIGTIIVWLPVAIYLFIAGSTIPAVGITIFGLISSTMDNFLRTIIVSKRTQMPSPLILIGMIGGLFLFGILGFILGPLILAYLLVILELYRTKKTPSLFIKKSGEN